MYNLDINPSIQGVPFGDILAFLGTVSLTSDRPLPSVRDSVLDITSPLIWWGGVRRVYASSAISMNYNVRGTL